MQEPFILYIKNWLWWCWILIPYICFSTREHIWQIDIKVLVSTHDCQNLLVILFERSANWARILAKKSSLDCQLNAQLKSNCSGSLNLFIRVAIVSCKWQSYYSIVLILDAIKSGASHHFSLTCGIDVVLFQHILHLWWLLPQVAHLIPAFQWKSLAHIFHLFTSKEITDASPHWQHAVQSCLVNPYRMAPQSKCYLKQFGLANKYLLNPLFNISAMRLQC